MMLKARTLWTVDDVSPLPTVSKGATTQAAKSTSTPVHVCVTSRLLGPGCGVHTPAKLHSM